MFRASVDASIEPVCAFEDPDEKYHVSISKSVDKKLIWIHTGAAMQSEMLYVSSATPEEPFQVCAPRIPKHLFAAAVAVA